MKQQHDRAHSLAKNIATELINAGAMAVVLMGSHARGDATTHSDIDLYVISEGPGYWLERRDGFLVSTSWRTVAQIEAEFTSPADAGGAIPGWRQAVILEDPDCLAAALVDRATHWTWDVIGEDRLNDWVAEQLTGYAEEVHALISQFRQRNLRFAAVERSLLAVRVPVIMGVHRRILYESENYLWDRVAEEMGLEWAKNQSAALGLTGQPFDDSCDGALALYIMACESAYILFDARQRTVIEQACHLARQSSGDVNLNSVILILIETDGRFLMIEEYRGCCRHELVFSVRCC